MVKVDCFSVIIFWFMILHGMKIEGRRLMGRPVELSCGSDSGILMNRREDGECKQIGYIKCVKGYCCTIIARAAPPQLSSSSNNKLLVVVIDEGHQQYPLMLPPSLPTITPRRLCGNEYDERDDMNEQNSQEVEKKNEESIDDVQMGYDSDSKRNPENTLNMPLENEDNQSGGGRGDGPSESFDDKDSRLRDGTTFTTSSVYVDDKDGNDDLAENKNLKSQIATWDHFYQESVENMNNQLKRPYKTYEGDQYGEDSTETTDDGGGGNRRGTNDDFVKGWVGVYPNKEGKEKRVGPRRANGKYSVKKVNANDGEGR